MGSSSVSLSLPTFTPALSTTFNHFPRTPQLGFLLSLWIPTLGVLEKLLAHPQGPEHDFWRLDRPIREAESMKPWSLAKARWAFALATNMRGVGWNYGSLKLPKPSKRSLGRTRTGYILSQLLWVVVSAVAIELPIPFVMGKPIPTRWSWYGTPAIMRSEFVIAWTGYWATTFEYAIGAAATVALGLCTPKVYQYRARVHPLRRLLTLTTTGLAANVWQHSGLHDTCRILGKVLASAVETGDASLQAWPSNLIKTAADRSCRPSP